MAVQHKHACEDKCNRDRSEGDERRGRRMRMKEGTLGLRREVTPLTPAVYSLQGPRTAVKAGERQGEMYLTSDVAYRLEGRSHICLDLLSTSRHHSSPR